MFVIVRTTRALCAALFICLAGSVLAGANPPPEAFGSLPLFEGWRLSPDAKHAAVIQPQNGRPVILIYTLGAPTGSKPAGYAIGDAIARDIRWLSNDRLAVVFTKNMHLHGAGMLRQWDATIAMDVDGTNESAMDGRVSAIDPGDPDHIYMEMWEWRIGGVSVYRTKSRGGGVGNIVERGVAGTMQWILDEHGKPVARVDTNKKLEESVFSRTGDDWQKIASFGAASGGQWQAVVEGEMYDGPTLAVRKIGSTGTSSLERMDLSGHPQGTIFQDPNYDIDGVLHDEWTGKVIGVSYESERRQAHYFDPSIEALQEGLERALPGNSVFISSRSLSGNEAIVTVAGPKQPLAFLFYDRTTKQAHVIANAYPGLTPTDLGEVRPLSYRARDGLEIHGYLTLPPGISNSRALPLVIFPHGGPEARDALSFNWWAQFMANRGYAVFQPNFRGSTGYGAVFHHAGDGQWGHGMLNDIADGVKTLIADGTVDPAKVCIVGASYGGYAALAEATFDPDLYVCAASFGGIGDVEGQFGYESVMTRGGILTMADMTRLTGAGIDETTALDAISPAKHADKVRAPVLLMHSVLDVIVPIDQSREELAALKAAGKTVDFVQLEGDDHFLSLSQTRTEVLKELEAFLAKYLGPSTPAAH